MAEHQAETGVLTETDRETISEAIWLWDQTPEQTVEDHVLPVIERVVAAHKARWQAEALTRLVTRPERRVQHGVAWEDRLNVICLCGKVCSAVIGKNPAGGFIGHPGSDTYVRTPAAQAFANHLREMNHPPAVSTPTAPEGGDHRG